MDDPNPIHAARKQRGISQLDASEAAGCSQSFVSRIEADKVPPVVTRIVRLADHLGVDAGALFARLTLATRRKPRRARRAA